VSSVSIAAMSLGRIGSDRIADAAGRCAELRVLLQAVLKSMESVDRMLLVLHQFHFLES
jgi:hypothetical protein